MSLQIHCRNLVALACFHFCTSQTFDQDYTGVSLTPYTKAEYKHFIPTPSHHTMEDILAMLEVIQGKFSRVVTLGAGYNANSGSYVRNLTYYTKSEPEVRIAEVAAKYNLQSGGKRITVLQGMWFHGQTQAETEVQVAIEAAEVANTIYPGTVEGMVLSHWQVGNTYDRANLTQMFQSFIRSSSAGNLKFGLWTECEEILDKSGNFLELLQSILIDTDFIICKIYPENYMMSKGPEDAFQSIAGKLQDFRRQLHKINGNLEVMGETQWASAGKDPWNSVENLRKYWETVGSWAKLNSFPMWFFEAIDNPRRLNYDTIFKLRAWCGWWELSSNSKSNQKEGYIEKKPKHVTG